MRDIYSLHVTTINPRQVSPYEELANAIVLQAVEDYKAVRAGRIPTISEEDQVNLKPDIVIKRLIAEKKDLIRFFKSKDFSIYTDLNPQFLLEKLDSMKIARWKPRFIYVEWDAELCKQELVKQNMSYSDISRLTKIRSNIISNCLRKKFVKQSIAKKMEEALGVLLIKKEWGK